MKNISYVRSVLLLYALLWSQLQLIAQSTIQPSLQGQDKGYYVVVGTFRVANNALHLQEKLQRSGYATDLIADSSSNLHYVYLGKYVQKERAINQVADIRKQKLFYDAWVKAYKVVKSSPEIVPQAEEKAQVSIGEDIEEEFTAERTQNSEFEINTNEVYFNLYNAANDRIIDGEVEIVDTEKARLIKKVKGNDYVALPDPKNGNRRLTLIGEVFGYRKVQVEVSYPFALADTASSNIELMGTIIMVNFDMIRYQKGDISVLYNVYFFNDAAIMIPESKYELNSLLTMLQENERYRIRLHGHSNGNYTGKLLIRSDENFFSLDNAKDGFGSAKELSFERAKTIKDWLVDNGINGDRIELKAWGGKRPLYDKHGANAKKNVRVEVEILSE